MGQLCSGVVGFTSKDGSGLAGLELAFDQQLAGQRWQEVFLSDVARRPLKPVADDKDALVLAEDLMGSGLVLTIDSAIQHFAREALLEQLNAFEASWAVAIVADPKNGAILAMVSLPDFDPNQPGRFDPNTLANHAIQDQFEPGSVIKPIVAAIALDAGLVTTDELIDCEDGVYRGKGFGVITEYSHHRYGKMDLRAVLAHSSNIGMAKIGQRAGPVVLYNGLSLFGFGKATGIGLPGEAKGLLRPPQTWTGYSITRVPFGQEIGVTCIQITKAICILANDGRLVRPYLVKAIIEPSGNLQTRHRSYQMAAQVGYIVRPEVARWLVRDAMVAVVEEGTGRPARLDNWQVFGKTGTAQVARQDGPGYQEDAYIASFVGGAPAEDPQVVVCVVICRPNVRLGKGYTGGTVAAPVAKRIIERTLTYLQAKPYRVAGNSRSDYRLDM
jgi:cell division protein FtsI/penicillin-binding protein 2